MSARLATIAPLLLGLLGAACAERAEETPAAAVRRVESPALGIAIADLPADFEVADDAGETLRLDATHPTGGSVEVTVGEPENGLNLQAEVVRRGDAFRAMPGGEYNGSRELGTPFGPAYYSRGSYDTADGGREEQTWIYALHPSGESRLLTLAYSYPAGEGQSRVNELLGLLGEIEALLGAGPPPGDDG